MQMPITLMILETMATDVYNIPTGQEITLASDYIGNIALYGSTVVWDTPWDGRQMVIFHIRFFSQCS